jgi:hypothetical protein
MNLKSLLHCLILFSLSCFGQKLELGKVTKPELLETKHVTDSSAAAAFIFKKARTDFKYSEEDGFTSVTVVQIKLKIYKKEGLVWANFRIPYYTGYETLADEYVEILSGYTYNLENGKVIKNKVTGEGKFKEQVNENWEVKSVTFPNVRVGSVIELEYRFKSQNLSILPEFQYQYSIPLDYAEYNTNIPELYIYNTIRRGYVPVATYQKREAASQNFDAQADRVKTTRVMSYYQIVTTYKASEIPALKEEDFVNNIDNYYGKIAQELKMIRYPDKDPKEIATTWEAVAKTIYDDKDFKEAVLKFDYFANELKTTINGVTELEEKAKKIFSFVKNKMNWNGKYGYYPKRKMEIAYAEKVGNVAEINLMLVSMLHMAGIDANPVLLSTRENGVATFPNRTLFNYVIAAAKIDNKIFLMDATEKFSDLNVLPIRTLNGEGRLIKNDGFSEGINLMPISNSKDVANIMANINKDGEVSGKVREQYSDYHALVFRKKYGDISKESYIEKLEKKASGLEITTYEVQNSTDLSKPIIENYDFITTNSAEIIGDKMYVSPFLFFTTSDNPFKQDNREYPVDFVFPDQDKYNVTLTIPEGYAVETLPQSKAVAMPENLGSFKYNISNNGNKVQLLYTQDINQAVITAEYYETLKNFFWEIVSKQTEKIVLKKV